MNIYGNSMVSDLETVLSSPLLKPFANAIKDCYLEALEDFPNEPIHLAEGLIAIPLDLDQPIALADKLEYHSKALDLHLTLEGCDQFNFKSLEDCNEEHRPYDIGDDYGLYSDLPDSTFESGPGDAVLIDTNLAHMALCGNGKVKKLVFKIVK